MRARSDTRWRRPLDPATNRVDPALLRSGRFDDAVEFALPDLPAREAIARYHCRLAPLSADVDLAELARRTEGRTGADIDGACRKAMLAAIDRHRRLRDERFEVAWQDFAPDMLASRDTR